MDKEKKIIENMTKDLSYPDQTDPHIQSKIFTKREFYNYKIPERPKMNVDNYNAIKTYRDGLCGDKDFKLLEQQNMLANLINPNTPYTGLLCFHGTGTGKCLSKDARLYVNGIMYDVASVWNTFSTSPFLKTDKNSEWSRPCIELSIDSFENGQIIKKKIELLYREKINTEIREIILENGNKISITYAHKLLKQNLEWSEFLNVCDFVYCYYNNNLSTSKIIQINKIDYDDFVYDLQIEDTHNFVAENILCHNTCVAYAIAERFKEMVQRYGTKIHILVPGPLNRDSWKNQLIQCTGETYYKIDKNAIITVEEEEKQKKNALANAMQYYRFMSYRSFYKKVLGDKIADKVVEKVGDESKVVVKYRKTEQGDFERELSSDRIFNLNNTLLIIDEAHNITGNSYGEAIKEIIKKSQNLRVVMLTATPMKNLADDIIELINFIRPISFQMEKDKIFTGDGYEMEIKPGGMEYFKNMASGYISHLRGADPLSFAKRVEVGTKHPDLLFTKIIPCEMSEFQRNVYTKVLEESNNADTLGRRTSSIANFVFPGLTSDKKGIIGYFGREGLNKIKNQLKVNGNLLNQKIGEYFGDTQESNYIVLSEDGKTITGKILHADYLRTFSVKFNEALTNINQLVNGKKGAQTVFVYSNLVKVGIDLFKRILIQNGYHEYQENRNAYKLNPESVCYLCGNKLIDHKGLNHDFGPSTFVVFTGTSSEDSEDIEQQEKFKVIPEVFNTYENRYGKLIKIVLGSRVMNEGVSLKNIGEIHILDVSFHFGRVDQAIGRGIRHCSHYKVMSKENMFPEVTVYKYCVTFADGTTSTEVELYRKAEKKYMLIKKIERAMQEVAIDCPLNVYGNMFEEEIKEFKNCGEPGKEPCPNVCGYQKCEYKCNDARLEREYYDPERKIYKVTENLLDYSTFTQGFARNEIEFAKNKIKEMFTRDFVYKLNNILNYVKREYNKSGKDMFDPFYVYSALDELIPITENEINNFRDTVYDKFGRSGYLIYRKIYYIFQPYDQNENVPMYYRMTNNIKIKKHWGLINYLKNTKPEIIDHILKETQHDDYDSESDTGKKISGYSFDDEYYNNREEFKYVGIIDKENKRKKITDEIEDVFKIRSKRSKHISKKLGSGIETFTGAVCYNAKSKGYLVKIAKELGIDMSDFKTRTKLCEVIKNKMLDMEKYGTSQNGDKMTYVMIPVNHSVYEFPYNLEDRVEYLIDKIKATIKFDIKIISKSNKSKTKYEIIIDDDERFKKYEDFLSGLKIEKKNNKIIIIVE